MSIRQWNSVPAAQPAFVFVAAVLFFASALPAGPLPPASRRPSPAEHSRSAPATPAEHSIAAKVRDVLARQQAAWNRGDVDGFLSGYWNSENTVFAGSSGILHGWMALRERYRKNYPDRAAMGTLEFSGLEVTPLCSSAALAVGRWHLRRAAGPIGGVFSLVLRQFPEGWRIVADHTSVVPEPVRAPAR
ncbi:MAG TPA: AtzH-like domain-containing protein [Candidatus Acidoferrales bacterium]|nr:AtzH-like domain-containing protein [Candidatus Acidoferrales bacterium]